MVDVPTQVSTKCVTSRLETTSPFTAVFSADDASHLTGISHTLCSAWFCVTVERSLSLFFFFKILENVSYTISKICEDKCESAAQYQMRLQGYQQILLNLVPP